MALLLSLGGPLLQRPLGMGVSALSLRCLHQSKLSKRSKPQELVQKTKKDKIIKIIFSCSCHWTLRLDRQKFHHGIASTNERAMRIESGTKVVLFAEKETTNYEVPKLITIDYLLCT